MKCEKSEEKKLSVCSLLPQHPPAPEPASNRNGARIRSGRFYHPFRSVRPHFSQKKNKIERGKVELPMCASQKKKPDLMQSRCVLIQTNVGQG